MSPEFLSVFASLAGVVALYFFVVYKLQASALKTQKKLIEDLEYRCSTLGYSNKDLQYKFHKLINEWNDLVDDINRKGGQAFLDSPGRVMSNTQFTDQDLRRLLQLVHPDKHNNSAMASDMTAKLNLLRKGTRP